VKLTQDQLESIKSTMGQMIAAGNVDYGKDRTNLAEVRSYARSMVMNHLKKCKELNGNVEYSSNPGSIKVPKVKEIPGLTMNLLPQELQDYVKTIV
jgi:hypothetical protein